MQCAVLIAFTRSPLLAFVATCCHLLYLSLSLFVTRRITRCQSLSLVVISCLLLYHLLLLVITRYTARLSFYKRSEFHIVLRDLLITVHFVDQSIFDVMILL